MKTYLKNIEHAVTQLFEAINNEKDELISLIGAREGALKEPEFFEKLGWDCDLMEDFDAAIVMNHLHRAAEARKALPETLAKADQKIRDITDNISLHENSERILCGAILQFAKQGISLVHRTLKNCPAGRKVGSQDLKDVIWHTRNHAMHHEESPRHRQPVMECFNALKTDFGVKFSLSAHPGVNLSKEVVETLHWQGFVTFKEDMLLLA